jgi:hypothetical protein
MHAFLNQYIQAHASKIGIAKGLDITHKAHNAVAGIQYVSNHLSVHFQNHFIIPSDSLYPFIQE